VERRVTTKQIIWLAAFAFALFAPILVMVLAPRPMGRQFWRDAAVALGFLGFALMGLQFIPVGRLRFLTDTFLLDGIYKVHHDLSRVAFYLVLAHPLLLVLQNPHNLVTLNLLGAPWKFRAGVLAFLVLVALIMTSVWRRWLRLSYEAWRILHNLLSVAVVGFSLFHILRVDYYTSHPLQRALWIVAAGIWTAMILYIRVLKPWQLLKLPYQVKEVIPERGATWTLVLEPVGHAGMDFRAGQVAWLSVDQSPFRIREHPFSFSSAEGHPDRLEFTIRELGDWTNQVGALKPGTRVYVDGPYGTFDMEDHHGKGYTFIAGGIGSTPVLSMLRTLAERGDQQPLVFFYGNPTWESITFREELEELSTKLNLKVVHTLERPSEGWQGETGYINKAVLERHAPLDRKECVYFICGPLPMIHAVTRALHQLGVAPSQIHSEKYEMA